MSAIFLYVDVFLVETGTSHGKVIVASIVNSVFCELLDIDDHKLHRYWVKYQKTTILMNIVMLIFMFLFQNTIHIFHDEYVGNF